MYQGRDTAKWYTVSEYYDEEGIQIEKKQALKHYIIVDKTIVKNARERKTTIWNICQRDRQGKLF